LVFGETGRGKSSVINMLAGANVAATSNDAIRCTFENTRYELTIKENLVHIYDTTGLNESPHGKVSLLRAVAGAFKLIRDLAHSGGIDLLVFVVRGGPGVMSSTVRNYELFYKAICRKEVPIVVVITGLEYEQDMDDWWKRNEQVFRDHGMVFHGHGCITAIKGKKIPGGHLLQKEYDRSRKTLEDLISTHCQRNAPWTQDADAWFQFTLGYMMNSLKSFFSAPRATRQRQVRDAFVEYAGLQGGDAKRIAARISGKLWRF
jgi:hypothetical protein